MKTPIAILSVLALAVPYTFAEEGKCEKPEGKRPNPKEHFEKMDADDSGTVSLEEFKSNPRAKENPEKAEEIFKKMDADSSGDITFEEMIKFHKMHRPPHREGGPGKEGDGEEGEGKGKRNGGPTID